MCLRGASEVQHEVLDRLPGRPLHVFVVWLPMMQQDEESQVPQAMQAIPDSRVTHFWDEARELSKAYSPILGLEYDLHTLDRALIFRWLLHVQLRLKGGPRFQPAWDVYLVFTRQAKWGDTPPAPDFWMHQLRVSETHRLKGERLAAAVRQHLSTDESNSRTAASFHQTLS